jgi:hypothetical protein
MKSNKFVKINVFVPLTHADLIRKVIGEAGAGKFGNYDFCSFSSRGIGRFRPNEKAKPFLGEKNKIEEVEEERIEFICEKDKVKSVIKAIRKFHPYEEPIIDIHELLSEDEF